MTIYVITSHYTWGDTEHETIVEVTERADSAEFYRKDFHVTEEPDASADEMLVVAELNQWLHDNYSAGAHWIVETMPDVRHVIELRRQTVGQYRVALERHWLGMEDYAADVRAEIF